MSKSLLITNITANKSAEENINTLFLLHPTNPVGHLEIHLVNDIQKDIADVINTIAGVNEAGILLTDAHGAATPHCPFRTWFIPWNGIKFVEARMIG